MFSLQCSQAPFVQAGSKSCVGNLLDNFIDLFIYSIYIKLKYEYIEGTKINIIGRIEHRTSIVSLFALNSKLVLEFTLKLLAS